MRCRRQCSETVLALLLGASAAAARVASLATPGSIPNFRDVGGLPAADGRVVRTGLLLRSATPSNATAVDAEALRRAGLRTVLDLRGRVDAERDPGDRLLAGDTTYLPLLTENMMRSALVQRARSNGRLKFAKLMAIGAVKKLSPSRRVRHWMGGALDIRLARLLDEVSERARAAEERERRRSVSGGGGACAAAERERRRVPASSAAAGVCPPSALPHWPPPPIPRACAHLSRPSPGDATRSLLADRLGARE